MPSGQEQRNDPGVLEQVAVGTGLSGAFVDNDATVESSGETRCAFALAVAANFYGCANHIQTASAINADFTRQTVVHAAGEFDATSGHATSSSGATVVVPGGRIATIHVANHSGAFDAYGVLLQPC